MIVSGGTGAGKTTLLNVLSGFISDRERIVTIEDAAELMLRQRHVVRLETRPPNIEGKGAVRQRELVINALRMRPDRIVVGEVRGEEALDMLQAMNTGHDGSSDDGPRQQPARRAVPARHDGRDGELNMPERAVRQQIASAIDFIVQVTRLSDGTAKGHGSHRNHRHGRRGHHDAGHLRVRKDRRSRRMAKSADVSERRASVRSAASASPRRAFSCRSTCSST